MYFDFTYLLFIAPALLLALWAQYRIKATYAAADQMPAPLSGASAARHILDSAGLHDVNVEQIPGHLTDHYDPREKVLRLSPDVYQRSTLAAVGIAAHEAGHALQDAKHYAPLVVRNVIVPVATFGSNAGVWLCFAGLVFHMQALLLAGIVLFSGMVIFQLVNLPVEFNASSRAKAQLVELGIVQAHERTYIDKVLGAAALTYVAATLQSVMILLYYVSRLNGSSRD